MAGVRGRGVGVARHSSAKAGETAAARIRTKPPCRRIVTGLLLMPSRGCGATSRRGTEKLNRFPDCPVHVVCVLYRLSSLPCLGASVISGQVGLLRAGGLVIIPAAARLCSPCPHGTEAMPATSGTKRQIHRTGLDPRPEPRYGSRPLRELMRPQSQDRDCPRSLRHWNIREPAAVGHGLHGGPTATGELCPLGWTRKGGCGG